MEMIFCGATYAKTQGATGVKDAQRYWIKQSNKSRTSFATKKGAGSPSVLDGSTEATTTRMVKGNWRASHRRLATRLRAQGKLHRAICAVSAGCDILHAEEALTEESDQQRKEG